MLKTLAIVTVVWIHSFQRMGEEWPPLVWRIAFLTQFAVPTFFFVSGYLYYRPPETPDRHSLRRRLRRVLLPYLVASAAALTFRALVFGEPVTLTYAAFALATGDAWGIYYFIPMLLGAILLVELVARMWSLVWPLFASLLAAGFAFDIWLIRVPAFFEIPGSFWQIRNPLRWWGYVLAGWLVAANKRRLEQLGQAGRRRVGVALLACVAAAYLYYCVYLPPPYWSRTALVLQCVTIYGVIGGTFVLFFNGPQYGVVRLISDMTYPIYLYHLFFVESAWRFADALQIRRHGPAFAAGLACVGIVYGAQRLLGRYARMLVG